MKIESIEVLKSNSYGAFIGTLSDEELQRYQEYLRGNLKAHHNGYCENMGSVWYYLHQRTKAELKRRGLGYTIMRNEGVGNAEWE